MLLLPLLLSTQGVLSHRRIIHGHETTIESYPFMVAVLQSKIEGKYCGGTILAPKWVLTSIQCPQGVVFYGHTNLHDEWDPANALDMVKATVKVRIPYVSKTEPGERDMALLRLQKAIPWSERAQPAKLPPPGFEITGSYDVDVAILGWGINEKGNESPILKEAAVKAISNEDCGEMYEGVRIISSFVLCLGEQEEFRGVCFGDQGGPAILADGTIVGTASFGYEGSGGVCGGIERPSGYMKVSKFIAAIEEVTGLKRNASGYLSEAQ